MNGSLEFSIFIFLLPKNWLNIFIDDPFLNNITKLEQKNKIKNGLLYKRLPKYTEFCKG